MSTTYRPKRAPGHKLGHRSWRTSFITNSERGAVLAKDAGILWLDNDLHGTRRLEAWVNDHGAPLAVWLGKGEKFEYKTWAQLEHLTHRYGGHEYHLRDAHEALHDNFAHGRKTELEIKDLRPWSTEQYLRPALERLVRQIEAAYGPKYHDDVWVKILSDMGGGDAYALKIFAILREIDPELVTLLSVRGAARFKSYAGHTEITYLRGSAVARR